MDYRLLLDTAVLAGEIMLESGAETHRVEDTVSRILGTCDVEHVEAVVMSTSIIATISDPSMDAVTVVCRVTDRDILLNRIYLVNNVSRKLCGEKIDLEEAHQELKEIRNRKQFNNTLNCLCIILITSLFPLLLGGGYMESLVGIGTGMVLSMAILLGDKIKLNPFVTNILGSALVTVLPGILGQISMIKFSSELVVIGSIMPLLPGVSITNAVRDTLQGDFVSGGARVLEAFVKALAIALGVGAGLVINSV